MNISKMNIKYPLVALIMMMTLAWACEDEFDKHYDPELPENSELTLMDLIEQQENLSTFAEMIRKVGYDTILSSDQTYTVWAPVNEELTGINMTDMQAVSRIVTNHIARFTHTASTSSYPVYMVNNKILLFSTTAPGRSQFGAVSLLSMNNLAKNGILHTLNGNNPYLENIWEALDYPTTDSIANYLYSFNTHIFSPYLSTLIDYEDGKPVYDSVFFTSNEMWSNYSGIGFLAEEDSTYTMIVPTNEAWDDAYRKIAPYFLSNDLNNPDSIQEKNTRYALVKDLTFRGKINPADYAVDDTLTSIRQSRFADPAHLFVGAEKQEMSNGWIYKTNHLQYNHWEAWNQEIKLEAESYWVRDDVDESVTRISTYYDPDNADISNYICLNVNPDKTSSTPNVTFALPNVLAAKYDIYCVFQPDVLTMPNNPRASKARCEILQFNRNNSRWNTVARQTPANNTIDALVRTEMLIYEGFEFPYANVISSIEDINIYKIRITCFRGDVNRMKIDYILLKPVH